MTTITTTTATGIRSATQAEAGRCIEALTLSFSHDPPSRWVWPDPEQYARAFPRFVRAFAGGAFEAGTAWYTDGFAGVALWHPPGHAPDEQAVIEVIETTVEPARRDAVFAMFEQMDAFHPAKPHWHLPLLGVHPARQGEGIGSALLARGLAECDRDRLPAYLEATSRRNAALYERHGFRAAGTIDLAGVLTLTPMLREPRSFQ